MGNTIFIIWRESIEALLVIGILHAWLSHDPQGARGMKFLWGGVVGGLLLALLFGTVMLGMSALLDPDMLDRFQALMMLAASGLIVHMVLWMKQHGRTLKKEMESRLSDAASTSSYGAVALIAAIAVAREGAETVVFLYGSAATQSGMALWQFIAAAALGLALALATFMLLSRGGRFLSWKHFFALSEVVLLLLACSMLAGATEKMIDFEWLPALMDPVWDASSWLDDGSGLGRILATFTGYRAHPTLTMMLFLAAFWSFILFRFRRLRT